MQKNTFLPEDIQPLDEEEEEVEEEEDASGGEEDEEAEGEEEELSWNDVFTGIQEAADEAIPEDGAADKSEQGMSVSLTVLIYSHGVALRLR